MAIEIKHTCSFESNDYLIVESTPDNKILIEGEVGSNLMQLLFDIPTAIKFAKSIRTEINKAKEVKND